MAPNSFVKTYPIPCALSCNGKTLNCNIMKLTQRAVLVDSMTLSLHVHDTFTAQFSLNGVGVIVEGVVVKTYDQFRGKHGLEQAGHHINELAFRGPSSEALKTITEFLKTIGSTII